MTSPTIQVAAQRFPLTYLDKAEQVFLHPSSQYSWQEIVSGASVRSESGGNRRMSAVARNTFRGFHRINKAGLGAQEEFINYFVHNPSKLVAKLTGVRSRDDLHRLSNRICAAIRSRLRNIKWDQLRSYNKIRKPVDLYIEHLVGMAIELDEVRAALVPLLFLPLDSQILASPSLFTDEELRLHGLNRKSTYKDIDSEKIYADLQEKLSGKATALATARRRAFYVIYFDLVWNDRDRNWGGNLFETNP